MKLILTSTLGASRLAEGQWQPCPMEDSRGLLTELKQAAGEEVSGLIIASDPEAFQMNDAQLRDKALSLQQSGVPLKGLALCDDRNRGELPSLLDSCRLLFLSGGHVPTQNRFFQQIGLKQALRHYEGTVVGISAGSMNSAALVYAQPELPGEAVDPAYRRFLPGLALTRVRLLPHFVPESEETLDGLETWRDISLPDSFLHPFVCLADGAYLLQQGREAEKVTLIGPAWLCREGRLIPLCGDGKRSEFAVEDLI